MSSVGSGDSRGGDEDDDSSNDDEDELEVPGARASQR